MRDYVAIQQKFSNWLDMKAKGHNFNRHLLSNPEFLSPCIEKELIDFAGLVDKDSNMDPREFDPTFFPPDVDYEKLAKEQRESWEAENKQSLSHAQIQQQTLQEKKKTILLERRYDRDAKDDK
jgi:hypothetical protein